MRLLLDQGLPLTTASMLRALALDVIHLGEIGMAKACDTEIISHAREQDRVVVTLDADFHAILAYSGAEKPSVIRIREEGLKAPAACRLISIICNRFAHELRTGCVITYNASKARIRMLPINPL